MMAKKFSELWDKMSPESRARSDARTKEMLAEMGWTEEKAAKIKRIAAQAGPEDDLVAFVERALASNPL
jgi:hypothetical protein